MPIGSVKSSGRSSSSIRIKSDRATKSSTQASVKHLPTDVDQARDRVKARQVVGADQVSETFSVPAGARPSSTLSEGKKLATEVLIRFIAMSMNPETLDHPKKAPTSKTEV